MPTPNFPGPKYNDIIKTDKQIVSVPLDNVDWGGRPVSTKTPVKNEETIRHVKGEG